jgi:hypothetical protein
MSGAVFAKDHKDPSTTTDVGLAVSAQQGIVGYNSAIGTNSENDLDQIHGIGLLNVQQNGGANSSQADANTLAAIINADNAGHSSNGGTSDTNLPIAVNVQSSAIVGNHSAGPVTTSSVGVSTSSYEHEESSVGSEQSAGAFEQSSGFREQSASGHEQSSGIHAGVHASTASAASSTLSPPASSAASNSSFSAGFGAGEQSSGFHEQSASGHEQSAGAFEQSAFLAQQSAGAGTRFNAWDNTFANQQTNNTLNNLGVTGMVNISQNVGNNSMQQASNTAAVVIGK